MKSLTDYILTLLLAFSGLPGKQSPNTKVSSPSSKAASPLLTAHPPKAV